jgi:hypothetical protein
MLENNEQFVSEDQKSWLFVQSWQITENRERSEAIVDGVIKAAQRNRDALTEVGQLNHYLESYTRNQSIDYLKKISIRRPANSMGLSARYLAPRT